MSQTPLPLDITARVEQAAELGRGVYVKRLPHGPIYVQYRILPGGGFLDRSYETEREAAVALDAWVTAWGIRAQEQEEQRKGTR